MPIVHGHIEPKLALRQYATCVECRRTYHPKSADQACLELCDECFEAAKYPNEPALTVHVRPRPYRPKSEVVL